MTLLPPASCVAMVRLFVKTHNKKYCKGNKMDYAAFQSILTVQNITVFVLAIFVGYHVVWNVTPALHTPLMAVTNAISGIIIVGALLQTEVINGEAITFTSIIGAVAVFLASINIFGGFMVTRRMLEMFKKKAPKAEAATSK